MVGAPSSTLPLLLGGGHLQPHPCGLEQEPQPQATILVLLQMILVS